MKKKISWLIRDEGGAITVMTIIMMVAFVGILAVVIDLGHLHTVQNELRNAADAAALRWGPAPYVHDATPVGRLPAEPPWPHGRLPLRRRRIKPTAIILPCNQPRCRHRRLVIYYPRPREVSPGTSGGYSEFCPLGPRQYGPHAKTIPASLRSGSNAVKVTARIEMTDYGLRVR